MDGQLERVGEALSDLLTELKSRGHHAALVSDPERERARFGPLTDGAVFAIDHEPWVLDYCFLSWRTAFQCALKGTPDTRYQLFSCVLEMQEIRQSPRSFTEIAQAARAAAEDRSLTDQIEAALVLRGLLPGRLNGPLRIATEAGYRTALLIDQVPGPGNSERACSANSETITDVAQKIVDKHDGSHPPVLDQLWLRSLAGIELLISAD